MEHLSIEEIINKDLEFFKTCTKSKTCEECETKVCVSIIAVADFPSKFGSFKIIGFINNKDNEEHIAILKECNEVINGSGVLTRIHSSCLTGDALGSLRCDCGPQLGTALQMIEKEGCGIIVYLQQEGRGIGLLNKLRAYALQDEGFDTWDANVMLGFSPDDRDYEVAAEILNKLDITSVRLITNNPEKIMQLEKHIPVTERVPLELPVSKHNIAYMKTKKNKFGHFLHIDE